MTMTDGCAQMLSRGDQIGSYRVRQRLGAGGMGEVYLADHRHIDKKAAIKVLLPELSTDEGVIARFFTEARAASRIKHPGIVEIIDCEIDPRGRAYIAMEFLDGESLGGSLDRVGSFDLTSGLGIIGQIAGALAAAHAKGIVHRDLKPDNVFLASTPGAETPISVKILDFGIAKLIAADDGQKRRTQTGNLLGTPLYMSPEQCRGAGEIDHRTDIYSLGCIAFELIAGRPPFVKDGAGELIAAHLTEPAPDIATFQSSVQPDLGQLVTSMLAKDPGARPQTMLDVVHEIETLLGMPAGQFLKLVQPPPGFPLAPEPDDDSALPPEPAEPTSSSKIRSLVGGTRVLPEAPREAPPKATTLSHTAAELTSPTYPAPRRRAAWLVAIPAIALIAGIGVVVARRPPHPVDHPSPSREETVRPTGAATPPPPPLPIPPPPRVDDGVSQTTSLEKPTVSVKRDLETRVEQRTSTRKRKPRRSTSIDSKQFNYIVPE